MKKLLGILFLIFGFFAAFFFEDEINFKKWKTVAEKGDAEAQHSLGQMYYQGIGVLQDYKQAFYWSKKSAEQGYAHAQHDLGVMYSNGQGVIQDYKKAVYWLKK